MTGLVTLAESSGLWKAIRLRIKQSQESEVKFESEYSTSP
jgi:hypothetical protein